jgi:lipopolysaccharide heptosyltransferase II
MLDHLDIYDPRERAAVGILDLAIRAALLPARIRRRRKGSVSRILLLRLERIGDLLMSLGAIRSVRTLAPDAEIDLVVGPWNERIAHLIREVTRVDVLAAPWLARGGPSHSTQALGQRALSWRSRHYDLSINFEGDIRTHLLPWLAGAHRRVGFGQAGGGPLLTDVVDHDGRRHVAANGLALVERAFDLPPGSLPDERSSEGLARSRLSVPESARVAARAALAQAAGGRLPETLLAVHVPGGRAIKQWPPARFAEVAAALATEIQAAVVLTGTPEDRTLVDEAHQVLRQRGMPTIRLESGVDLVVLAGILSASRLVLTGDSGPMHLAAAVGTPVLAVFGPSMPWRYAPLVEPHRIVRVDLPCSPCNRIRLPPERCRGHVPDCLEDVTIDAVVAAGRELLRTIVKAEAAPPYGPRRQ